MGVLDLRSRVLSGQVLYLHCHGGHGRTGTVAIPLIASLCSVSGEKAQKFVVEATLTTRLNDAKKSGTLFDRMDAMPETGAQKRAAFFTTIEVAKLLWGEMRLTRSHEQWAADGTGKDPCAKGRLSVVSSRSRFKRAPDSTGAFSRR